MQIIFLSRLQIILSFFIIWPLFQIAALRIVALIDDKFFDSNNYILKTKKWEQNGRFYKTVFFVHKWKHLLPDGSRIQKNGFRKRNLKNFENNYIKQFIVQTGRAEIGHWLQIFPFWLFGFWCPPFIILFMLLYALLVNIPCIIAQRYNRPRLIKIYEMKMKNSININK